MPRLFCVAWCLYRAYLQLCADLRLCYLCYLLIVSMGHVSSQRADNSNFTLQIQPVGTQRMWQDHAAQVHCGNPEDLAGENHRAGEAAGVPRPRGAGEDGGIHAAGDELYAMQWQFSVISSLCVSTLYADSETEGPVHSGTFT